MMIPPDRRFANVNPEDVVVTNSEAVAVGTYQGKIWSKAADGTIHRWDDKAHLEEGLTDLTWKGSVSGSNVQSDVPYTLISEFVHIDISRIIDMSSYEGDILVSGLPFPPENTSVVITSHGSNVNYPTNRFTIMWVVASGSTEAELRAYGEGGSTNITGSDIGGANGFRSQLIYRRQQS